MRFLAGLAICAALLGSAPLAAQDHDAPLTAEQAIEEARQVYSARDLPDSSCGEALPGEILVCRRLENQDRYRTPSSSELAAAAGQAPDDGVPRAPDLYGGMTGGVTVARGCFIPPCPPPTAILIDLDALPDPPPGSDAARYGYRPREEEEDAP